ncbi:MAG: tetratricopeptide repeat protein [Armatimonadetes bacterium]|nr:tetratricopeptide repeat protein [Armatimonadota bacterium]
MELTMKATMWCLLVSLGAARLVPQAMAEDASNLRLELLLSPAAIDTPFGPQGADPTFYEGEDVELKLVLANREKNPLPVGASLEQSSWVPAVTFSIARLTPADRQSVVGARVKLTHYQPVLRQIENRAAGVLHPGESIETKWYATLNGAPLPPGDYLVSVSGSGASPFVPCPARLLRVVAATERLDQLNRLHHLGVRLRWAGRFDESLARFQQILALVPGSPTAYAEMGAVYRESGQYEKAIPLYERAIAILEAKALPPEEPMTTLTREDWIGGLRGGVTRCKRLMAQKQ